MQPPGPNYYLSCGRINIPGNQGISRGWTDTYRFFLGGQYFVLDGGDGQPPVPAGDYTLRITVNYANNMRQVTVSIPDYPGRDGVGPLKNEKALDYEPAEHDQ